MSELKIGTADEAGVALLVEWAAAEGWNPGLGDAPAFYATDPQGFLIGTLDGEAVAGVSVVSTGPAFGFLGFYICKPQWRGQGYGWAIWQAGMARMEGRTVGLDGVPDQQPNYRKSGFVLAHRNIRHGGIAQATEPRDPRLQPLLSVPYEAVADYDARHFGFRRDAFLRVWLSGQEVGRSGLAVVEDGELRGFGVIRACRIGHKIGPLFADDEATAELLYQGLTSDVAGQEVFLDTPEPNRAAVDLARRHRLEPVFETARMYRGTDPGLPLAGIFGITTFELG